MLIIAPAGSTLLDVALHQKSLPQTLPVSEVTVSESGKASHFHVASSRGVCEQVTTLTFNVATYMSHMICPLNWMLLCPLQSNRQLPNNQSQAECEPCNIEFYYSRELHNTYCRILRHRTIPNSKVSKTVMGFLVEKNHKLKHGVTCYCKVNRIYSLVRQKFPFRKIVQVDYFVVMIGARCRNPLKDWYQRWIRRAILYLHIKLIYRELLLRYIRITTLYLEEE